MKNLYKKTDIFRCIHESHRGYKNSISVYHILKQKNCFPDGCLYFRWRCKQLNKKARCPRGYNHVGRNCFGCREFYEEKIHNYPELQISKDKYSEFVKELEDFEDWLENNRFRSIEIAGRIKNIKPRFDQKIYPKASFLSFKGFLITFDDIFLDRLHVEDYVYARISRDYFRKMGLRPGDKIEARGFVSIDQGRIILGRLNSLDIYERGKESVWNEEAVVLAQEMAVELPVQPEVCFRCPYGALVDVEYKKDHRSHRNRKLFCLKGVREYKDCYVRAEYCGMDSEANAVPHKECSSNGEVIK